MRNFVEIDAMFIILLNSFSVNVTNKQGKNGLHIYIYILHNIFSAPPKKIQKSP